jgi:hypothetical protein
MKQQREIDELMHTIGDALSDLAANQPGETEAWLAGMGEPAEVAIPDGDEVMWFKVSCSRHALADIPSLARKTPA